MKFNLWIFFQNDSPPKFPQRKVDVELSEYVKVGSEIPLPAARDADSGAFGVQRYEIASGNVNNAFRLATRSLNNALYLDLVVNANLDREFKPNYQLEIVAVDGGNPPLTDKLLVNVTILDSNDLAPIFDESRYQISLENFTLGREFLQVHAVDKDSGPNAAVEYFLLPSPRESHRFFRVNQKTGGIFVAQTLPENQQTFELLVAARDKGRICAKSIVSACKGVSVRLWCDS